MKKDDIVLVTIEDMGTSGEGIGKADGFTLFIKDAIIGDIVEAKVMKVKKNYGYARMMRIVAASKDRVEAKCQYSRACGGCQIQTMSYPKQLEYKQNLISNNLARIGGFDKEYIDEIMEPIVGMEEPFHYRNKAQYPVGMNKNGEIITGFYAGRSHDIIANTDCALGVAENKIILEKILKYMKECHVSAYDEKSHKGLVRHVLIRKGFKTGQLMVCLVINGNKLPKEDYLVEELISLPGMTSISYNKNTENTNVILGKKTINIWGKAYIEDYIGDIKFRISPKSFYQVNPVQTENLYELALEYADLSLEDVVWDLYCGIGTISLFMTKKAKKVYGVEIVPEAIEDARVNAQINNIENVEFYVGKAEEVLPEKYDKEKIYADVIVVDPPRKGCDSACIETMIKMEPKKIVYVSCDSATMARDLKILTEAGYKLKRVRGVDQFGHTMHTETVALMAKQY